MWIWNNWSVITREQYTIHFMPFFGVRESVEPHRKNYEHLFMLNKKTLGPFFLKSWSNIPQRLSFIPWSVEIAWHNVIRLLSYEYKVFVPGDLMGILSFSYLIFTSSFVKSCSELVTAREGVETWLHASLNLLIAYTKFSGNSNGAESANDGSSKILVAPPPSQILSISYIFWEILAKLHIGVTVVGLAPPPQSWI